MEDISIITIVFILVVGIRLVARGIRVHAALKYKDFPEKRDQRIRLARTIMWVGVSMSFAALIWVVVLLIQQH